MRTFASFAVAFVFVLVGAAGCAKQGTSLTVVDHRRTGESKTYHESFDEAYYDVDGVGNVDLVLRRSRPSRELGRSDIVQTVHVRSVWNGVQAKSEFNTTQINSTVSYAIVSGDSGAVFEGAGAMFCTKKRDWGSDFLVGKLERAMLQPTRQAADGVSVFDCAEVRGGFRATRDGRKVRQMVNEMDRLFGPKPAPNAPPSTASS